MEGATKEVSMRRVIVSEYVTLDGVQRALGRERKDFADYAHEAAATGVWDGGR